MSPKKYVFRVLVYKEADETYTAVCLDLDIVEENHQTLQQATMSINEAVESHLKAAGEIGFPKELINRPAPKEYWRKLSEIIRPTPTVMTPFQYFTKTPTWPTGTYA